MRKLLLILACFLVIALQVSAKPNYSYTPFQFNYQANQNSQQYNEYPPLNPPLNPPQNIPLNPPQNDNNSNNYEKPDLPPINQPPPNYQNDYNYNIPPSDQNSTPIDTKPSTSTPLLNNNFGDNLNSIENTFNSKEYPLPMIPVNNSN